MVVAVSRLVRHKGYPELLRAMEAVPEARALGGRRPPRHRPWRGPLEPYFARAEAALGPRLRRLGYRHDVARLLAAADVFALPSHFEGLPMSVIEAMLTGLPVVATDVRGPREQVVEGETGLLVPPIEVPPLADALRAAGGRPGAPRAHGRGRAGAGAGALHGSEGDGADARPAGALAVSAGAPGVPAAMTDDIVPVRRALLSVSDKTGLVEFGRFLAGQGVEILSTGGTARALREAGVPVTRGGRPHRLPRDPGRAREDAGAADPWRAARPARPARAPRADGGARHRADRPRRGEPLPLRGDGRGAAPASTTASRTSTSAARR